MSRRTPDPDSDPSGGASESQPENREPLPRRSERSDSGDAPEGRSAAELLSRPHVPALDALLGKPFKILDDGFVRVLDYMGDDAAVVQAARISYGAGTKQVHQDRGLIRYLMRHAHSTPYEMCDIKLHVRVPMDTWRQWVRHRTACLAAGTELIFDLPGGLRRLGRQAYPVKIEDLYKKFQPTMNRPRPDKQRNSHSKADRVRAMLLRQMNEDTGQLQHTHIANVYKSGVKPVFRMVLSDGKAVECTADHRFKFADGWKTLAGATGLRLLSRRAVWNAGRYEVYVNGRQLTDNTLHHDRSWLNDQYKIRCHRQVHLNEITSVSRLGGPSIKIKWVKHRRSAFNKLVVAKLVQIERIEYAGEKETYDVEVEGPYHNFVANGIVTHNSVNEYSTRYSVAIDATQQTPPDQWRLQSGLNRQGSAGALPREAGERLSEAERALQDEARRVYEERLAAGVAREQARKDLPLSTYTEAYWKINLHNLLHFLNLRMDDHAQEEIRAYARVIGEQIVAVWVPLVWEAFLDYRRHALQLSGIEVELVRLISRNDRAAATAAAARHGWLSRRKDGSLARNRERAEFEQKLTALGLDAPWA
jgi:flavin-dependent thymidylate synthase